MNGKWAYAYNHMHTRMYISFKNVDDASNYSTTQYTEFRRTQGSVISDSTNN
jgi:hypothetical protein